MEPDAYVNGLGLPGVYLGDAVIVFIVEGHGLDVIEHTQQMSLGREMYAC